MFRQTLLRAAYHKPSVRVSNRLQALRLRRPLTSGSGPSGNPPPNAKQSRILASLDRWIARVPRFMQGPLISLRKAPVSYVVSFAILHELTAVVPLAALVAGFHYFRWLPSYFAEGKWIIEGVEKMGRWFRRRGWIGEKEEADVEAQTRAGKARMFEEQRDEVSKVWNKNEGRGRLLVEVATAYAIVKALVPLRLFLSALWAPWFATRVLSPVKRALRGLLKSSP